MTVGRRSRALLASAALVLASCGAQTQLIVVIGTDLALPMQADRITLTVEGAEEADASSMPMTIEVPVANGMPSGGWTLGVRPRTGASQVIVRAEALLGTAPVVSTRVVTTFRAGETRYVPVLLSSRCAALRCPASLVCDANRGCVEPTVVDASTLPSTRPCAPSTERCGTQCVDTSRDRSNCGACGAACSGTCVQGICETRAVRELVAGARHTCARTQGGEMFCWGALGTNEVQQPARVSIGNVVQMAAGREHVCARTSDRRDACWGTNGSGQIGAQVQESSTPRALDRTDFTGTSRHIAAGAKHTCIATTEGMRCWGGNSRSQSGPMAAESIRSTPVPATLDVVHAAAGDAFTCFARALLPANSSNGAVSCFGDNTLGQCGATPPTLFSQPRDITFSDGSGLRRVTVLAAGAEHVCALREGASVLCWGSNARRQIGSNADVERQPLPQLVTNHSFSSIYAGGANTCGLDMDRRLWCWGDNTNRWLFDDSESRIATPRRVHWLSGRVRAVAIGAGATNTAGVAPTRICVALDSGLVYCWGDNQDGHRGVGSDAPSLSAPRLVVLPQ